MSEDFLHKQINKAAHMHLGGSYQVEKFSKGNLQTVQVPNGKIRDTTYIFTAPHGSTHSRSTTKPSEYEVHANPPKVHAARRPKGK